LEKGEGLRVGKGGRLKLGKKGMVKAGEKGGGLSTYNSSFFPTHNPPS
jgi:hypothetical protein